MTKYGLTITCVVLAWAHAVLSGVLFDMRSHDALASCLLGIGISLVAVIPFIGFVESEMNQKVAKR